MEKGGWIAVVVALITTAGVVASKYIEVGSKTASAAPVAPEIPTRDLSSPTAPIQLAGTWHDQFGSKFLFTVDGMHITLSGSNGDKLMNGSGAAADGTLKVAITNTADPGTIRCVGPVGTATAQSATCTDPDGSTFEWQLSR